MSFVTLENYQQVLGRQKLLLEDYIIYVLVKTYARVNWRRIARGRDPLDVFQHRVLASSYVSTFSQFLERLCLSLGLQSVRIESEVLNYLQRNSDKVLDYIRHNSIYLVAKAHDIYRKLRDTFKKVEAKVENK